MGLGPTNAAQRGPIFGKRLACHAALALLGISRALSTRGSGLQDGDSGSLCSGLIYSIAPQRWSGHAFSIFYYLLL